MNTPLLEGNVATNRESDFQSLLNENKRLSDALQNAIDRGNEQRNELHDLKESMRHLHKLLLPYYRVLQGIFGELDRVALETDFSQGAAQGSPQSDAKRRAWDSWKHKLGGKAAEFIEALLTHGELSNTQLGIVTGTTRKQTIYDTVHKLNKAGLLNKNGDKYSLKQL